MNAFVTFRFPGLTITKARGDEKKASPIDTNPTTSPDLSDDVLMHRIACGAGEALSVLFRRYARLVRAISYKILGDESEAEDTVQEVFLFIHRKSNLFDKSKSSVRSWIVQVTYHRAIDRLRYLQARHFYTQFDLENVTRELADESYKKAIDAVEQRHFRQLFKSLSPNQRQTMQLFFFEGLSFKEIALKLGQTRGNVKNHYFRGLHKLRKQLLKSTSTPHSGV
jgi:RNA polymerase sigma-70 factor (ECF subfamily)